MPVYQSSGVYIKETDLSQVVSPVSSSIGAIVGYTKKGPVTSPVLVTNQKQLRETFGKPDASVSYSVHSSLAFLQESRQLYFQRVIGSVWQAGGILFQVDGPGGATISFADFYDNVGRAYNMAATINALPASSHLFWVESLGPSVDSNLVKVGIVGKNILLNGPTVTATAVGTGGTLAADSYTVTIQAVSADATKSIPVVAAVATTTGTTSSIGVTWVAPVPSGKAAYFDIFVTTLAGTFKVSSVPVSGVASYTITAMPTTPALPVAPAAVYKDEFDLVVYDLTVSSTIPVELFTCSLGSKLDGFGQQMELQQLVNVLKPSNYIRVVNNTPVLGIINNVYTVLPAPLMSGVTNAPTALEVAAAWNVFADPDAYTVRILINGGYSNPSVQLAMDAICHTRGDCFAVLDMPTASQVNAQACVDYRNVTLNLNSNRSAIYSPDLYVDDPDNGQVIFVPPSGFIAGIYARTDYVAQAWFAPAGLNRGVLNVRGVRYKYDQGSRDLLASSQVNYMRSMPGRGTVVWEQLTLQAASSATSYVSVRRMFDVLEITVRNAMDYSLQEPNDPFLRRQVVQLIDEFLAAVKSSRGLIAYGVVADTSNNPSYLTGQGQLNIDIYATPTLPAAKIRTQWVITKQGIKFGDLIALGGNF